VGLTLALIACGGDADAPGEIPKGIEYPAFSGDLPDPGSLTGPVWLVGIDGATWDLIVPMLENGLLPNFARVLDGGSWGVLTSENPTISPALWSTIATGVPRTVHRVDNFLMRVPGSYEVVEAGPRDRHSPALWEWVGAAGGRSIVLGWFGSYPAEPVAGAYVSKGFDHENPASGQIHPPELADLLATETVVRIPRAAVEQIGAEGLLGDRLIEDARTIAWVEALAPRIDADLVVAYFSGVDVAQHLNWKHMDPAYEPFPDDAPREERLSGVIPAYYQYMDVVLGRLLDAAPEDATFVVVSDHGAGPMRPEDAFHFRLEALLRLLGLTVAAEDGTTDWTRTPVFTVSELYRRNKRIWINLEGIEPGGTVPLERAQATAENVAGRLERLRTEIGTPLFDSIEVRAGRDDWVPGDPAITVRFGPDALRTPTIRDGDETLDFAPVRVRHNDVSGDHRLEGIVILQGPAVRPGVLDAGATLYNIAPTVLYLLGLPQDGGMLRVAPEGGGVLEAALRPEFLADNPIRMIEGYPGVDRSALVRRRGDEAEIDPTHDEALERLRGLGYIE
jgi:predicted AlkP superfamily phosphohydrolase/phosphomutase